MMYMAKRKMSQLRLKNFKFNFNKMYANINIKYLEWIDIRTYIREAINKWIKLCIILELA